MYFSILFTSLRRLWTWENSTGTRREPFRRTVTQRERTRRHAVIVDDSEKCYDRLLKRGARPVAPLFSDESETLAYVKDLDGIWVELIGPRQETCSLSHDWKAWKSPPSLLPQAS